MTMKKKTKLTTQQKQYAENRAFGMSEERSAIAAGYAEKINEREAVQEEIARIRRITAANTGVTKEQVVQMFMDAADFAKILGDPAGLVAAAREIGKMLGYYAPEVKKTLIGVDKSTLKKALQEMSDDELHRIATAKVIDGESTRILDLPQVPTVQKE
jgi:hypothetical protein